MVVQSIGLFVLIVFITLNIAYIIKIIFNSASVTPEFHHPIAGRLFGTPLISLLLLPIILADYNLI